MTMPRICFVHRAAAAPADPIGTTPTQASPIQAAPIRGLLLGGVLLLALVLSACSRGGDQAPLQLEVVQAVSEQIKTRRAARQAPTERPPLTRAGLNEIRDPFIEVTLEDSGIFAYLAQLERRQDDHPGTVVIWRSEDNVTLSLRQGVLVASRGLGNDILSASAQDPTQASPDTYARRYDIRGLDNGRWRLSMACRRDDLGPDPITIVERRYPTRLIRESCQPARSVQTGPQSDRQSGQHSGEIVNHYWVDSRTGRIWQSRQWAGPAAGYLRIRQLTTGS